MLVNNGIINIGNNNANKVDNSINYENIIKELQILSEHTKENIEEGLNAATSKNQNKLITFLKNLKKETVELVKKLGLTTIEKLIEKYITKL